MSENINVQNEEEKEIKSFDLNIWKKMIPFIKPYKGKLILVFAFMILLSCLDLAMPLFQSYLVDEIINKNDVANIWKWASLYLGFVLTSCVSVYIFTRLSMYIELKLGYDLRDKEFKNLQNLSLTYYNKNAVGYMMSKLLSDTMKICELIAWGLTDIVWSLFYVIGVFIVMFNLNADLALIVLIIVPVIALLTYYFQNKLLKANRKIRKTNGILTGELNEGITGAKTSKTLVIEEKNAEEFKNTTSKMYRQTVYMSKLNAIFIPMIVFFGSCSTALVLYRGGVITADGVMKIGVLSAFLSYSLNIFEPIQNLARSLADFISIQANIERVVEVIEQEPLYKDKDEVIKKYGSNFEPKYDNWEDITGDIEFKNVSFKYPDGDEEILSNFSLKIPAGTNVAIVGETGAGKSTLVNLACRFFEPTSGEILIDGIDYRERSQLWLHSNIGYVLQTPHLFSGTIKENIKYGKLDATEKEIELAAKRVSADEVVKKFKEGYKTDVGENGDNLSTGEKQLISFARAIVSDPKIFVLDEATSSIDTQTEMMIQDAIDNVLAGRTSFIIAHRLSTIKKADMILVVKDGDIIERGSHKELIDKKGYYFDLYTKQFVDEKVSEIIN